jgi:hypothetical protein
MLGRKLVRSWNGRGIWSNLSDDLDGLHAAFGKHFENYQIEMVGRSAVFTAFA